MTTITILGGTGFAGRHLVREAASRGHAVIAVSRRAPEQADRIDGVDYREVDLVEGDLTPLVEASDVVISALSPRGALSGRLIEIDRRAADIAQRLGRRLLVVGGFSSLREVAGGPRVIEQPMPEGDHFTPAQREALASEATQMNDILQDLEARTDDLRWTFFSPGMEFGSHVPGAPTGDYRLGTDGVVLRDPAGRTAIGGADFALAVIDEVESATPHHGHTAVAY